MMSLCIADTAFTKNLQLPDTDGRDFRGIFSLHLFLFFRYSFALTNQTKVVAVKLNENFNYIILIANICSIVKSKWTMAD